MYGLVLEGGGAKGSYHIGAYKAIMEEGIEIKGVAGTSIGALNGAMIVQGDFDICYKLWEELTPSMILSEEDDIFNEFADLGVNFQDIKQIVKRIGGLVKSRGFSTEQFRESLDKYIDEDKVRESNKDFGIVTFNLTDMKPVEITVDEIPYGELKDYLMASAYLPVFKFEKLGGKIYIDGGIYDNLPFRILQNKGYKKLILVRTHGKGIVRKIQKEDLEPIIIAPSDDIGYSFSFESETARRNLKLGYYDALRALRGLEGFRYYIEPDTLEGFDISFILSLGEEQIKELNELIGVKHSNNIRNLFEYAIPKLGLILGLKNDFTYEEILIGLLERKAEELKIDRFKIYSIRELVELVKKTKAINIERETREQGILEKIIEKVDLASNFNKEGLILEVAEIIYCR